MPVLTQPFGSSWFEERGPQDAPTVLLLNGLGYSRWSWSWQWDSLPRLRLVQIENRGVGGSDLGPTPFSIADLADDAAGVLAALKISRVVVFGVSMGGMIAQEFALRHPHRTAGMVLGCTYCGGDETITMDEGTRSLMSRLAELKGSEEAIRGALDLNFSPAFQTARPAEVDRFVELRCRFAPPLETWKWQRDASLSFDASQRLSEYRDPALVLHGGDDPVVPPANLMVLRSKLKQAESHLYPGARHLFWIEHAQHVNALLEDFVHRCWSA